MASDSSLDLYTGGKRLAEYGAGHAAAEFDIGYEFNRSSELRLGYNTGYERFTLRVGSPTLPTASGQLSSTSIQYNLYDVDNAVIPRSGQCVTAGFQYFDHAPKAPGGFPSAQLNAVIFRKISKPASLFFGAEGATTFGEQSGIPQFFLGGGLRLGAYGRNEIHTDQYFLFRAGYIREMGHLNPLFGEKVYALAFYEVAKPYGGSSPSRIPTDVNAGLVINTLFGPVFLAGAYGNAGNHKIYFQLGRIF
jgi:NTE family protein